MALQYEGVTLPRERRKEGLSLSSPLGPFKPSSLLPQWPGDDDKAISIGDGKKKGIRAPTEEKE